MPTPSSHSTQPKSDSSKGKEPGIVRRLRAHRPPRIIVLPLILISLITLLTVPILHDLRLLSETGLALVEQEPTAVDHDGNLIVNIKNINPNNGMATVDLTYVTKDLDNDQVELWIASGGVTLKDGKLNYEKDTELHRVPIVMESPTVFVSGETKRATYKKQSAEIKIDQRTQGYLCPFDRYVIEFSFVLTDKSEQALHPKLWCELEDPHFVNAAPTLMTSLDKKAVVPNSMTVILDRPMYVKIFLGLSLLMGLGCVLWTLYKVSYTSITAMESFSLLAFDFTVLMAVPALRGVFVPSNLQFSLLFDFFVVLIWTAGLLTLVVNIFRHDFMIRTRQSPSANGRPDTVPFVGDRRDRANETQSIMSRRAAS